MEENEMRKLLSIALVLLLSLMFVGSASAIPAGALLWLDAGQGVISDGTGVATWQDQSGNGNNATRFKGTMSASASFFPKGLFPVVNFVKDGFFTLPTAPFRLQDLTVYAVVKQTEALDSRSAYFSTYSNAINWGYGVQLDVEGPWLRSFTSAGTDTTISDWIGAGCWEWPTLLTNEISATNNLKSMYVKGSLVGQNTVPGLSYFNGETASIGTLGQLDLDYFFMKGDIAEIIVYPSVDAGQRAAVESYLMGKYFIPEPATMSLLALGGLALLRRRRA